MVDRHSAGADDWLERDRHDLLSSSPTRAGGQAPLALVSAPQASLVVTTLADAVDANDGVLSLREAVDLANGSRGADTITFAPALLGGTIRLTGGPLTITDTLTIDGDPLDRGARGITIDGDRGSPLNGEYQFYNPVRIERTTARLEDLTITNGYGSGVAAARSNVEVHRGAITDNFANSGGDGIVVSGGQLLVAESAILRQGGETARAIAMRDDARVTVLDSDLGESTSNYGFGIRGSGTLIVERSTISEIAGDLAAGVDLVGAARIVDSTLSRNGWDIGGIVGKAIRIQGSLELVNSTISDTFTGEETYDTPAAVTLASGSVATVINSTITGTTLVGNMGGGSAFGIELGAGASLRLSNSIVDGAITGPGRLVSSGNNLFRDPMVAGSMPGDVLGITAAEVFAQTKAIGDGLRAGVLADNGGPTVTVALLDSPANPALDAAGPRAAPATDQRGVPRDGTPDIGAFELDRVPPTVAIALGDTTLTAGESTTVTFTFSETVAGFGPSDISLTGTSGSLADLAGSSAVWTAAFTPAAGAERPTNTIGVNAGSYTDIAGNPGTGGTSPGFAIDTLAPSVAIGLSDAAVAAGETLTVTFTFTEPVRGFAVGDIELDAPGRLTGLTPASDIVWAATFAPAANVATTAATIGVKAASYTDLAGNPGSGATSPAFAIDTNPSIPPAVLAPIAVDDSFAINGAMVARKGASLAILANDLAPAGKLVAKSVTLLDEPTGGTLTLKKGTLVFKPDPGFEGTEELRYTVADTAGRTSNQATVTIEVTQPPRTQAVADNFTVDGATMGRKGARLDILVNDSPGFGKLDAKSVTIIDGPDLGTATVGKGAVIYRPGPGVEAVDELSYTVADATGRPSAPAKVTIAVTQPPLTQAVADTFLLDAATLGKKGARLDILVNDSPGFGKLDTKSIVVTDDPANGTVALTKGRLLYTPEPGFDGTDTIRYTVADATGRPSNAATVSIEVRQPPSLTLADLLDAAPAPLPPTGPTVAAVSGAPLESLVLSAEVA